MPAQMNHSDAVFRVCVDEISEGRIRGHVVSRRLTAPISFQDVGDFLIKLEELMDRQNFPQAFERTRTFRPRPAGASHVPAADGMEGGMSKEEVEEERGAVATFALFVITRRNTTWQGIVDWLDGSPRSDYSSVLELIKLIDERVSN